MKFAVDARWMVGNYRGMGQYAHGNEPSHHIAYLYAVAGVPHKTQAMARVRGGLIHRPKTIFCRKSTAH